jgi:Fe-S-cluster containining protein
MSKKKEKHKYTSTHKKKGKKRKVIPFKSKSNPTPLKEKLKKVYCETVNLDTTCKGICECCNVACPAMNFCEYTQLINEIWDTVSRSEKIRLISTSVEYFFRNEFEKWGMQCLEKKCLLLDEENKGCECYESRPLSCRIYGLWPEDVYKERVDKFEKAYEGLLKREELPLHTQCPNVKRVDESVELTNEIIEGLYAQLDNIDRKIGDFSDSQIEQKENYRTFHDWLLFSIFGEEWLSKLTSFMLAADKETIVAQIEALKTVIAEKFAKDMPDPTTKEEHE